MDKASLRQLAEQGISQSGGESPLRLMSERCWDHGEALGDAALLITSRALEIICDNWQTTGYLSPEPLNESLKRHLPSVLDSSEQEGRLAGARMLKDEVISLLMG